jgi:hypothetical protein
MKWNIRAQKRLETILPGKAYVKGRRWIMIFATLRGELNRNDAQLALHLVGGESPAEYAKAESALREQGIDALLDDPRLLKGLLESRVATEASYPMFAYVVVRHALLAVNMHDRMLADYVASVLMHFGLRDRARRISEMDDQTYETLTDVSADVETTDARRSLLARVHLGNYALWLGGIFPDYIAHRQWSRGGPDLDYYDTMGQKGFRLAAEHRLANEYGLVPLYGAAADHFVVLRIALNQVSDALLFPHRSTPDRLLRQVSNDAILRRE